MLILDKLPPMHRNRIGTWRCQNHRYLHLPDSLAIWNHLEKFTPKEDRTTTCVIKDIYFQCAEHGPEEAIGEWN